METTKTFSSLDETCQCSYPTYEEWKQRSEVNCPNEHILVLILPMRNGNHLQIISFPILYVQVLILPMRNGNTIAQVRFRGRQSSYPTYEEWKPFPGLRKKLQQ